MVEVEVCVESPAGVRAAHAAGAARVELCCALGEGGLTPSSGALSAAVALAVVDVVALVRPRGGDFLYGEDELAVMAHDVRRARELGAAGVALGCLTAGGEIDERRTAAMVELARPLPVTFHRAFDLVREPLRELETLAALGVARVLTSGGAPSAPEGARAIAALVAAAHGRITVVAAGGVRPGNAASLVRATGVQEVHLAAAARTESRMRHRNPGPRLASALPSEPYAHRETDEEAVRALVAALRA